MKRTEDGLSLEWDSTVNHPLQCQDGGQAGELWYYEPYNCLGVKTFMILQD